MPKKKKHDKKKRERAKKDGVVVFLVTWFGVQFLFSPKKNLYESRLWSLKSRLSLFPSLSFPSWKCWKFVDFFLKFLGEYRGKFFPTLREDHGSFSINKNEAEQRSKVGVPNFGAR